MLSEEDSRLFEAAKRAQVNRNTAIHIIDNARASDILAGSFVRVLLEMPSRSEGYLVARIHGTTNGEPYSGFSTNANQTTTVYLVLELPPTLAAINGVQYQLNSVSNSTMSEGEFREWLALIRNEPTMRTPTVYELGEVASHIHPFEVSRHRGVLHNNLASSSSINGNVAAGMAAASPIARPVSQPSPQQQQQRALSARAQARQIWQSLAASTSSGVMPPLPQPGNRSPAASVEGPLTGAAAARAGNNGMMNGDTSSNGSPRQSPSTEGGNGNYGANRYVRQGTMMSRDLNRNPREDGQASHDMAGAEESATELYGYNTNSNNNGAGEAYPNDDGRRSVSPRPSGNVPASAAAIPFMTRGAADHRMESEDEEMERRLRQDIMNHLAQECVLFPKDPTGYKLSRLRLLERDMIEYLQHIRDEIQGKQENCIICIDHVPTVILLPCKHKVMCRLCAPSVSQCPVCRSQIAEMFEPEEI
ncbi:hypothetical protein ABB37_06912 [Leptomonas pyrrhocoris]|uniref:RING-type domain-containing protein n=1 Tax=Leptomonas pyrrhocoris TaxID=157538 RepID=A0A0M9FWQ1_LEPPY|nr:hypothetical protein ABB37_06912 [Leptomonas pyrrhocoris]KPA77533.1 hypothetical protein ABB37_06912 [Leptomonas pyrrhocoris]|eukprot:XP_015655972.1 hypothetical protein ABB37_06912 [Leptomonas pyrrhocoris]